MISNKGIILDGNRRVAILRQIIKNEFMNPSKLEDFKNLKVFMVKDDIPSKEISYLETKLQISEDEKLEYDPINMYLKINKLLNQQIEDGANSEVAAKNVASLMGTKYSPKDIEKSKKFLL